MIPVNVDKESWDKIMFTSTTLTKIFNFLDEKFHSYIKTVNTRNSMKVQQITV